MTNDLAMDNLSSLFEALSQQRFTGKLDIQAASTTWTLYFCLGRLVWAAGGTHRIRRWYRLLNQHCPQVRLKSIRLQEIDKSQSWKYQALTLLVRQQTIASEQAVAAIKSTIAEVLFDILQQEEKVGLIFACNLSDEQTVLDTSLIPINPVQALQEAEQVWEAWREAGLAALSPNVAPVIKQPEELEKLAAPRVYQTLVKLIDGKRTLRDMAVQVKQDVLMLTRSLMPYIRKQAIGLTNIPDLPQPNLSPKASTDSKKEAAVAIAPTTEEQGTKQTEQTPLSTASTPETPSPITPPKLIRPLVAHVEDSLQERQIMEEILTQAKYGCVGIEDSMLALPLLLQHKPDVIFLDLVMPVANGYEICAQIRRVSIFKDTPVIILTGNDGIVDRVRAKMVGATDFLAKPIVDQKVLAVLEKYVNSSSLPDTKSISDLRLQTSN